MKPLKRKPLKRIDFATAPPSFDKLPVVGESSYEDEDDSHDVDSTSSDSGDDLHGSGSGGNDDGATLKKSGLSSLVPHSASVSRPPSSTVGGNATGPNGAFGRWLCVPAIIVMNISLKLSPLQIPP